MEYDIYFENEDANKTISAALAELNNIFFIENSSSESEKNMSEDEENVLVISDDENFENLNEIDLNNFKFVENSDNYIEDKVYDDLKSKVKKFFKNEKCSCNSKCYEKIGYKWFLEHRAEFESLNKKMWDMIIKGDDILICRITYEALVRVNHKYIDVIIKHLREYGLEERIYGNTGRSPKNMNRVDINYNMSCEIYEFLKNYSNIHDIPSPGWHFNKVSSPIIFLPTNYSYSSVYRNYIQAFKDKYENEMHVISETSFVRIWKLLIPSLRFMSLKSDLCETCEKSKLEIHIHIAYDWAQNVQVLYSPQQIGLIFFKSPRKVHIFGVCNTGNFPHTEQTNYIIDEAELPDEGKQGKGVNCILSLVWHAIHKYNYGEKKLVIVCDNCVGQNKNNYSLFFYSWLIDHGMYDEIELNFMILGHTKFICDSCFGLIKILYQKSKHYLDRKGFQYYNFKDYFQTFKKIPNIQKYHNFYFTSKELGVVCYKDRLEDDYKKITIRPFSYDSSILPSKINIRPLSLKR
ncbi:hypothetical protein C1645_819411 [Glomus cerebriforme]|uniref:DUF7869 domain-containing protein n=1 Tax=Glomus cerebriforme TaxID=658196 RepID=A0A397T5J6_9GLOM|nr:hypothetical protein C1645_819411 [Glomus cerebriforme]